MQEQRLYILIFGRQRTWEVCHCSDKAKTKNGIKLLDETIYQTYALEQVHFDNEYKVFVDIHTDCMHMYA